MQCQFCLDRQIEPNESIGLYQHRPICDACLGPILDNINGTQVIQDTDQDPSSLDSRKKRSLAVLDKYEDDFEGWELFENEVLNSRDDFFNHKPPALINLTNDQIKSQISRRKALLFAFKIKMERWSEVIDNIQREERRQANLLGVEKSVKEKSKTPASGKKVSDKKKAQMAQLMGMTVEEMELVGKTARIEEFRGVLTEKADPVPDVKAKDDTIRQALIEVQQQQMKLPSEGVTLKPALRCQTCKKLTCICPK